MDKSNLNRTRGLDRSQIDDLCDSFDRGWRSGLQPDLAEYLGRFEGRDREYLFRELLFLEWEYRRKLGQVIDCAHYKSKFPEFAELIDPKSLATRNSEPPSTGYGSQKEDGATLGDADEADERSGGSKRLMQDGKRYDLLNLHAEGALGQVFRAFDRQLRREVALKEIQPKHANRSEPRRRFIVEAEVTGNLEHPGIVPIYGLGAHADGRPFYAMRFIEGKSLSVAIEEFHDPGQSGSGRDRQVDDANSPDAKTQSLASHGRPSPGRFSDLAFRELLGRFIAVCNAVGYAHSRGVLHRDLKPSNIMLGTFGETHVVDWGLAKVLRDSQVNKSNLDIDHSSFDENEDPTGKRNSECTVAKADATIATSIPTINDALHAIQRTQSDQTQGGQVIGTPPYMSPEQAAGEIERMGPASDIYSLGVILYALLTGRTPHRGSMQEVLTAVRRGEFVAPRSIRHDVPAGLNAICLKSMSKSPVERYDNCNDLVHDVEAYLADEPVAAFAESAIVRTRRWLRKRPVIASSLTATVFVGLLSFAVAFAIINSKNRALDLSLANEKAEREKAVRNEKKAEAEFRRAKAAIDDYFTAVSHSNELKQKYPGMHEFRLKLLEKAQKYYEENATKLAVSLIGIRGCKNPGLLGWRGYETTTIQGDQGWFSVWPKDWGASRRSWERCFPTS